MYKDWKELVEQKIKELENKIYELDEELKILESSNSVFDILNKRKQKLKELYIRKIESDKENLEEQIQKLKNSSFNIGDLSSLDIPLDLSDKEYCEKKVEYSDRSIEKIEDLVLVHKTDFAPINGVMYSPKDTGAKSHRSYEYNDKKYEYEFLVGNDTLHFCLNGPVVDHIYGSWSNKKYAVLVPFDKVNKDNLLHCSPEDTYFQNKVILPSNSVIICPNEEKENISRQNPNVEIITYNNSISLDEAIKCAIFYKGYIYEDIFGHGWVKDKDNNQLRIIKEENNIKDKDSRHYWSENLKYARLESLCNKTIAVIKSLINNNLEDMNDEKLASIIESISLFGEPRFEKKDFLLYVSLLINKIKDEKIEIFEEFFIETLEEINNVINNKNKDLQFYQILNYINSTIVLELLLCSGIKKGIFDFSNNEVEKNVIHK